MLIRILKEGCSEQLYCGQSDFQLSKEPHTDRWSWEWRCGVEELTSRTMVSVKIPWTVNGSLRS
jgi:hypothetical protein